MATEASAASTTHQNPGDETLQHLRSQTTSHYLSDAGLEQKCEFFIGGVAGNSLMAKVDDETPLKFILSGVFEIDRRDFYFTPDANFDPTNNFGAPLEKVKTTCRLLPVKRNPTYDFSKTHFPTYIANLNNLEKMAPAPPQADVQSCIVQTNKGSPAIKLSHSLFEALKIDDGEDTSTGKNKESDDNTRYTAETSKDHDQNNYTQSMIADDFDIKDWPVQFRNRNLLSQISTSHRIIPIPVYTSKHELILPSEYEKKLSGAIVEVYFALKHYYLKSKNKSIVTAILRDMVVLQGPLLPVQSPPRNLKRRDVPPNAPAPKKKKT